MSTTTSQSTPLVLLHGVNNAPPVWAPVRRALAGIDTIAPALPVDSDITAIATSLLDQLPERFALAGHSLGGYVALEMLRIAPERLTALALVNSHDGADSDEVRQRRVSSAAAARSGGYDELVEAATAASYAPESLQDETLMAARRDLTSLYGAEAFAAHQEAASGRQDRREVLAAAKVPVLVVTGAAEQVIPVQAQREMAEAVGAEHVVIGGAGHMLPAERPAELARVLGDWLAPAGDDRNLPAHEINGEGDITIFMLHGAYGDGRYFANTSDYFTDRGYRVVTWHAPGYHGTMAPRGTSIEAHAEAAAALVEAVGTEKNVILGHSMGGLIAPAAANKLGDRVHGVILSASSAGLSTFSEEDQQRFIAERVAPIAQGLTIGEYAPALLKAMMGPGASGPLVDRVVEVVCEMPTDVFVSAMDAIIEHDGRPALADLTVPVLLLAGEHDGACTPAGMQLMADLVPDSEFHVLPGVGHYPFAEEPKVYHDLVLDFLARRVGKP